MTNYLQDNIALLEGEVNAYLEAFNQMDLDAVMKHFSEDALYEPGDGSVHQGTASLREAFLPQFEYAFGTLYFQEEGRIVDWRERTIVLRWTCRIDARSARFYSLATWLRLALGRLRYGSRAQWKGLDVLYFNSGNKIYKKLTYANYAALKLDRLSDS